MIINQLNCLVTRGQEFHLFGLPNKIWQNWIQENSWEGSGGNILFWVWEIGWEGRSGTVYKVRKIPKNLILFSLFISREELNNMMVKKGIPLKSDRRDEV